MLICIIWCRCRYVRQVSRLVNISIQCSFQLILPIIPPIIERCVACAAVWERSTVTRNTELKMHILRKLTGEMLCNKARQLGDRGKGCCIEHVINFTTKKKHSDFLLAMAMAGAGVCGQFMKQLNERHTRYWWDLTPNRYTTSNDHVNNQQNRHYPKQVELLKEASKWKSKKEKNTKILIPKQTGRVKSIPIEELIKKMLIMR